jgi:ATP-binding cassette subfamily B protein
MDNLSGYADRPFAFVLRYLRQRLASHVVIMTAVVAAVACSVGTQYGIKFLVDGLAEGPARSGGVWLAARHLSSSNRSCAMLLFRPVAWNAHQPYHRHLQRRLHR